MLKSAHFAFALTLLLFTHEAAAGLAPHASFSHGFSSHAASSHVSSSPSKSGFGAFSSRAAAAAPPSAPAPARAPSGSFGAFGSAAAAPRQSDSALSQQLSKEAAQAKALHTLDQRNGATNGAAAAPDRNPAPQAAPGYAQSAPPQPANAQAPTTVIVHQDGGGLGHVLAGAMIARSMNAHAQGGYYPGPNYNGGGSNGNGVAHGGGTSVFSVLLTLSLLALIVWGAWFAWRGLRRRRAARLDADKPNYSFKRN